MAHRRTSTSALSTLNATIDTELMDQLRQFADANTQGNVSSALRLLLTQGLSSGGLSGLGRSMQKTGYNDGLRAGLTEARAAIASALNGLWR